MAVPVLLLAAVAGLLITTPVSWRLARNHPAKIALVLIIGAQSLCLLTAAICMMLILLS